MSTQVRAAIYCRVSTDRQEEEGTSLDTQRDRARQYCAQHGYQAAAEFREVYSGFELRRPELDRLRQLIRAGAVDIVVCYAVDRLGRNQAHLAILLHEMDEAGVRVEFVTEKFEDSAVGKFILAAKGFAAEVEREKIIERTQRGRRARVASGKPVAGCKAPYGYRWRDGDKSGLEPDPETAPIVQRIFKDIAAGASLRGMARTLQEEGVPPPMHRPDRPATRWHVGSLRFIALNEQYTGQAIAYRHERVKNNGKKYSARRRDVSGHVPLPEGTIPPLVSLDLWQAAHATLEANRYQAVRRVPHPESHLLRAGFALCGSCGARLVASSSHYKQTYCCKTRNRGGECLSPAHIVAHILDRVVWEAVHPYLIDPGLLADELDRLHQDDTTADDLHAVDRALADVDKQQANYVANLGLVTGQAAALIAQKLEDLGAQRARLEEERQAILDQRTSWQQARTQLGSLAACRRENHSRTNA